MVAHVSSVAFRGIDIVEIDVQVQIATGVPAFSIVGLPDKTIAESKDRVRSALFSMGLSLPSKKITVNLSPADIFKEGSHFDLPIAVGILCCLDVLSLEDIYNYIMLGELSLDASIAQVSGILPAAIGASALGKGIICPYANAEEASWSGNDGIIASKTLIELINHFKGVSFISPPDQKSVEYKNIYPDLKDVKGQETAKRALEIAASGGHNLLMIGPPGSGKSMLASRMPGILPPLGSKEILELSMIESIAGLISEGGISRNRPFRSPHHSCSMPAMVGGGKMAKPGEISLSHNGVLFLDELPEFGREVLDSLRQPLENREVSISRVNSHITYPANFQLIAAMNPCRCGYFSDIERACNKVPKCAFDYQSKISGPLFDRIDINIEVNSLRPEEIDKKAESESSEEVRKRVIKVREVQLARFVQESITTNSQANGELLQKIAIIDDNAKELLKMAMDKFGLSMRGYNRSLRVARTIADMEEKEVISRNHMAEALSYRRIRISGY